MFRGVTGYLRSRTVVFILSTLAAGAGLMLAEWYVGQAGRTVEVVVAAREIPPYYLVTGNDLKGNDPLFRIEARAAGGLPSESLAGTASLAGGMTRSVIPRGAVVTPAYFSGASGDKGGSLARILRDAELTGAFAWRFSADDAVAGRVEPGDHVDILVAVNEGLLPADNGGEPVTVHAGVLVLDVVKATPNAPAGGGITLVFADDDQGDLTKSLLAARNRGGVIFLRLLPAPGQVPGQGGGVHEE